MYLVLHITIYTLHAFGIDLQSEDISEKIAFQVGQHSTQMHILKLVQML